MNREPVDTSSNFRRSPKMSELIARELASHIVDQQLAEGTLLETEKEMADSLGVGRSTVREALRLLETRGVITIRAGANGGPSVRRPRPSDLQEALTLILQFEGASLRDVIHARRALEPVIASLAAHRIEPAMLDALDATVDEIMDNLEDHSIFLSQNARFHRLIAEASGSVILLVFTETLREIADGAQMGIEYAPAQREAVAVAHRKIIEALRNGRPEEARDAMEHHLQEAAEYWNRRYHHLLEAPVRWVR